MYNNIPPVYNTPPTHQSRIIPNILITIIIGGIIAIIVVLNLPKAAPAEDASVEIISSTAINQLDQAVASLNLSTVTNCNSACNYYFIADHQYIDDTATAYVRIGTAVIDETNFTSFPLYALTFKNTSDGYQFIESTTLISEEEL